MAWYATDRVRLSRRSKRSRPFIATLFIATAILGLAGAAHAEQVRLVGLTDDNMLVLFDSTHPGETKQVRVTGVSGSLLGIDYRPANSLAYGITSANDLYTIDSDTGAATLVSTLTLPFDGGLHSGVDFNPQSDRLRLVGSNGQNLRIHADIGATATDGTVAYAPNDPHFGKKPNITATAYSNSVAGAFSTKTFDIDSVLDILVLQEPPNDGVLQTVGPLNIDFGPLGGFDIVTDDSGKDSAFAASSSTLYAIDLATGAATALGTIGDSSVNLVGLTIVIQTAPPLAK